MKLRYCTLRVTRETGSRITGTKHNELMNVSGIVELVCNVILSHLLNSKSLKTVVLK